MPAATPLGLEGLIDLDRKGVDIRPTLLRVLTDQYLQSETHTPDEARQYTELALRLIDETDIATRAAVAARLAPHAIAPRPVVLRLARDVTLVAEPVLRHSPSLTPDDLDLIARERGQPFADIIAKRRRSGETAAEAPAAMPDVAPKYRSEALELSELFFAADSDERRLILINLEYSSWPAASLTAPLQRTDVWRLESAALQHNRPAASRELEAALGISLRQAQRIVEDELGEPIVAAAKAMNLPADVLQRILLFLNSRIGQSVDRVYELAALHREIATVAAGRLIAILREADPIVRKPRHETMNWQSAAESARRALTEINSGRSNQRQLVNRATASAGR